MIAGLEMAVADVACAIDRSECDGFAIGEVELVMTLAGTELTLV